MPSGNADTRTGKLKILAGPEALLKLMERATRLSDVTVGKGVLQWKSHRGSPGATIPGSRIESVTQHDNAFVVRLKHGGTGISVLTFAAASNRAAAEWVLAIEHIMAAPPAPARPSRAVAATGDAALALDQRPIKLKYRKLGKTGQGEIQEKHYDLLVIACDPTSLIDVCQFTDDELNIFKQFRRYTFNTTLVKVTVPANPPAHAVILAPTPLEALDGGIYAFRNESVKQFGCLANTMTENLVTIYQLAGPDLKIQDLNATLKACDWWPFGLEFEIIKGFITPYFNHFDEDSLAAGLPWKLLDIQGQKHTLLVHGSACFESVLHVWAYPNLMLDYFENADPPLLPQDLANSRIVILGAGPSGLMFAARLKDLGYSNIDILEVQDRYGGKTLTVAHAGPYPAGRHEDTICELGTCYMSPAYSWPSMLPPYLSFVKYLDQEGVLKNNRQIDFAKDDKNFRGIDTTGQLPSDFGVTGVIDYNQYVVLKAASELGLSDWWWDRVTAQADLAYALAHYGVVHVEYMGIDMPMPTSPPPTDFLKQKYGDFLEDQGLSALVGILQYGYEVQGYGPVANIAAFYGLTWITPAVAWGILLSAVGMDVPVVTAWTQGWGDIWTQLVEKKQLNITYPALVTSIERA